MSTVTAAVGVVANTMIGIPFYARKEDKNCTWCHSVPPQLNGEGENYIARGYRLDRVLAREGAQGEKAGEKTGSNALPVSLWFTGQHEEHFSADRRETFLPKVEIISGGPIGDSDVSYFVEWRAVSLSARKDGTLQDRSGRFEDIFVVWDAGGDGRHALRLGQFRALGQIDVSRRLSVSEPGVFKNNLQGKPDSNSRIQGLRSVSPSDRSPGVSYTLQSVAEEEPSDGLFHTVTLAFPGEMSIPLSSEARKEASPEFEITPKGVFLETFYRWNGLNSVGVHGFVSGERFLVTGLAAYNVNIAGNLSALVAAGVDGGADIPTRQRYSAQLEYIPDLGTEFVTPVAGFRFEHVHNNDSEPTYIPYGGLSLFNTNHAVVIQAEGRIQEGANVLILDISSIF